MSFTTQRTCNLFGISPCPNDTFIMYALIKGMINAPIIHTVFADVQELNKKTVLGDLDIAKISVATYPYIVNEYSILCAGGALGLSCGPILVSKKYKTMEEVLKERQNYTIGIPGKLTTANRLLDLYGKIAGKREEMSFEEILPAVKNGSIDIGLVIHEGRFEYEKYGLHKIMDLGDFWEERYTMPLPLGIIVIKRSLGNEYKREFERAIQNSLQYSYEHKEEVLSYCKQYAQTMDNDILTQHIATFVNEYSMDLGKVGFEAISVLTGIDIKEM